MNTKSRAMKVSVGWSKRSKIRINVKMSLKNRSQCILLQAGWSKYAFRCILVACYSGGLLMVEVDKNNTPELYF